jgi:serine/threonine protein kinase
MAATTARWFLHAGLLRSGDGERFAREGRILAQLTHPHIARLLDAGLDAHGAPYLVLEHVDGLPMDRYCSEHAVAHAHSRLVLHRDLKPANILVTGEGQVKLLDFGIAKLMRAEADGGDATELTQRAGRAYTLHYAAPEQVQGGEVSTATDVYALGVLLFQLLVDRHPLLQGETGPLDTMRQILEVEPPRMSQAVLGGDARNGADTDSRRRLSRSLRGDLDTVVAKALKKVPADRYQHAAALAEDLRHWLALEPISARPDSLGYRASRFVRRHWLGVAAATAVLLSLAGGLGVAWWKAQALARQHAQPGRAGRGG